MNAFWRWYEKHLLFNISLTLFLFGLQLVHLYWLGAHVISLKLVDYSFFSPQGFWYYCILIIDYTEIPALISAGLLYLNELRKAFNLKSILFIVLLLSQFLHIFWITDEFILETFTKDTAVIFPVWLAWVAIGIDYLEVPVIIDTGRRLIYALRERKLTAVAKALGKNG